MFINLRAGLAPVALAISVSFIAPTASAAESTERRPVQLVAKKKAEAKAPAAEDDGKIWFAFFNGDYEKPSLQDRGFLIDIVGFLFFELGGAIWAPMLLVGAPFDMEWVAPVLVYLAVVWVFSAIGTFFWWTGVGLLAWIVVFAASWIGTEVALANLDRPSIKLGADSKD